MLLKQISRRGIYERMFKQNEALARFSVYSIVRVEIVFTL